MNPREKTINYDGTVIELTGSGVMHTLPYSSKIEKLRVGDRLFIDNVMYVIEGFGYSRSMFEKDKLFHTVCIRTLESVEQFKRKHAIVPHILQRRGTYCHIGLVHTLEDLTD